MTGFGDGSGITWQTTTSTPLHSIITGWMLFLTPNQQCQSTEGSHMHTYKQTINFCGENKCLRKRELIFFLYLL